MAPLKELLDLTYELEALLSLALMREGVPPRLYELIAAKAAAINAAAGGEGTVVAETESPEDFVADSYSIEDSHEASAPALAEEIAESGAEEKIDRAGIAVERTERTIKAEKREYEAPEASKAGEALRKRFSLNDKFRFRREIFGGRDADFSQALDAIAASDNLSDAEDYLYSQLHLDPDDENVKSLVEIISGYFS